MLSLTHSMHEPVEEQTCGEGQFPLPMHSTQTPDAAQYGVPAPALQLALEVHAVSQVCVAGEHL